MGFFDELGTIINDVTSVGDEMIQTVKETVDSIKESTDELANLGDEISIEPKETTEPVEQ